MHPVFCSIFLLISKYNCRARTYSSCIAQGQNSHVWLSYISYPADTCENHCMGWCFYKPVGAPAEELLHGYVLTFKIHLLAFTSTVTSTVAIFNGVIFPTLQIKCFFLFMKGLFMKKAAHMNYFSNYGCWLRAFAMHCMNCIKKHVLQAYCEPYWWFGCLH